MSSPDLPPGWAYRQLQDVALMSSGGTPRSGDPRFYAGGTIPWAVIGDLTDGPVLKTRQQITEAALSASAAKLIPPGTVLLAMYGSIGKLGLSGVPMATNQAIACLRPRLEILTDRWLFWYLMQQRPELATKGAGAAQKNISQSLLRPWPIPVPPIDEQHRIVAGLEDHLSRLDAANDYLAAGRCRSDALLRGLEAQLLAEPAPQARITDVLLHSIGGIWGLAPGAGEIDVDVLRVTELRARVASTEAPRHAGQ